MNTNPAISLIFVNYRSARYLKAALESLFFFEKETSFYEVLVVNNDPSESDQLEALRQIFPFLLIESGENSGFGRGNNLGASQAKGSFLGFINPDVRFTGPYFQQILAVFREKPQLGVLGMALLDEKRQPEEWSGGTDPSLWTVFLNNVFPSRKLSRSDHEPFSLDWVSGGALFIRKELFTTIGGFDERFFLYFEDVDLCKEVRQRGFSVLRDPELSLIHLGGKSQESAHLQKKYFALSQREYFRKHRPRWEVFFLECLQFLFRKM